MIQRENRPVSLDLMRLQRATRSYLEIIEAVLPTVENLDNGIVLHEQMLAARIEVAVVARINSTLIGES